MYTCILTENKYLYIQTNPFKTTRVFHDQLNPIGHSQTQITAKTEFQHPSNDLSSE